MAEMKMAYQAMANKWRRRRRLTAKTWRHRSAKLEENLA
jgi:hypothetical protein